MADTTIPQQQYAAPAVTVKDETEQYIQHTPTWMVVVRGVQVFFGFVILIMAGYLIHGNALGANAFALVCGLFTWWVVTYLLVSEKVASCRQAYNIWAVLALDFLMALFWLASLGANAALRASFNTKVSVTGCYDDGSAVSAHHCTIAKRVAVATDTGLAIMSAIAGLSALQWLLFVATLVFHGHTYRLWHQEHKKPSADNATVEMKAQGTPMLAAHDPTTTSAQPQYTDQQQYQSQMYPPHEQPNTAYQQQTVPAAYPPQQQQPDAYAQQQQQQQQQHPTAYPPQQQPDAYGQQQQQPAQPYAGYPDPNQAAQYQQYHEQQHQQQQQTYSPHGTPAPGQPYYPPQHPPQQ